MTDVELEILLIVLRREDASTIWDNIREDLVGAAKGEILRRIELKKGDL